jgi:hypothetical protein
MPEPNLADRVEILEQKVRILETLPPRMEAVAWQIIQLRKEMSVEFRSVRDEIRAVDAGLGDEIRAVDARLGDEIRAVDAGLRDEIRAVDAGLRDEIRAVDAGLRQAIRAVDVGLRVEMETREASLLEKIRAEIRDGDEQTRTYMRVLHEEVISKIATLGAGH